MGRNGSWSPLTVARRCDNAQLTALGGVRAPPGRENMSEPTVRLVDLDVIKKFSLAVRRDEAPAAEVLEALDASRATVLAAIGDDVPVKKRASRPRKAAA